MNSEKLHVATQLTNYIAALEGHRNYIDECIKMESDQPSNRHYKIIPAYVHPLSPSGPMGSTIEWKTKRPDGQSKATTIDDESNPHQSLKLIPDLVNLPELLTLYRMRLSERIKSLQSQFDQL